MIYMQSSILVLRSSDLSEQISPIFLWEDRFREFIKNKVKRIQNFNKKDELENTILALDKVYLDREKIQAIFNHVAKSAAEIFASKLTIEVMKNLIRENKTESFEYRKNEESKTEFFEYKGKNLSDEDLETSIEIIKEITKSLLNIEGDAIFEAAFRVFDEKQLDRYQHLIKNSSDKNVEERQYWHEKTNLSGIIDILYTILSKQSQIEAAKPKWNNIVGSSVIDHEKIGKLTDDLHKHKIDLMDFITDLMRVFAACFLHQYPKNWQLQGPVLKIIHEDKNHEGTGSDETYRDFCKDFRSILHKNAEVSRQTSDKNTILPH